MTTSAFSTRSLAYVLLLIVGLCWPALTALAQQAPPIAASATNAAKASTRALPNYHGELLRWQKDSLAQIVAVGTAETSFILDALVWNTASTASLTEVQIGVVIWKDNAASGINSASKEIVQVLIGPPLLTAILPGQAEATGTMPWRTADILRVLGKQGLQFVTFQVGIVAAKWNDGTSFSYDLERLRDFIATENEQQDNQLKNFDPKRFEVFNQEGAKRAAKLAEAFK